jgi:hypothetical protein
LKALLEVMCREWSLSATETRFLYLGTPVDLSKTPTQLGMGENVELEITTMIVKLVLQSPDFSDIVTAQMLRNTPLSAHVNHFLKIHGRPLCGAGMVCLFNGYSVDVNKTPDDLMLPETTHLTLRYAWPCFKVIDEKTGSGVLFVYPLTASLRGLLVNACAKLGAVAVNDHRLLYKGMTLDVAMTPKQLALGDRVEVTLALKKLSINIKSTGHSTIGWTTVDAAVTPLDTFMSMYCDSLDIDRASVQFSLNGSVLDGSKTADYYNIRDTVTVRATPTFAKRSSSQGVNASSPSASPGGSVSTCAICMERPCNCVLVPCGHTALCLACAKSVEICPMCRVQVASRQQMFQ